MNEIKTIIDQLITFSFCPFNPNANLCHMRYLKDIVIDETTKKLKKLANDNNTILGRIIMFPVNNSYSIYLISNIRGNNVDVVWLDYEKGIKDNKLTEYGELSINYINYIIKQNEKAGLMLTPKFL